MGRPGPGHLAIRAAWATMACPLDGPIISVVGALGRWVRPAVYGSPEWGNTRGGWTHGGGGTSGVGKMSGGR